jgi:cytochrome P450
VLISPWTLHRDARWFARPLAFEPERWAADPAGPRQCIGNTFALTEAALLTR